MTSSSISLSELLTCPKPVKLHTTDFVDGIVQSVTSGKAVPGIVIARLGQGKKAYIVDGHARVEGYRKAGIAEIEVAAELKLKSEAEVVAEHVKHNMTSTVDLVKLAGAIAFMESNGLSVPLAIIEFSELMRKAISVIRKWPKDVRAQFANFIEQQATRFSDIQVSPQFYVALAPVTDEELLRRVITYIIRVLQNKEESSEFCLPNPDQVHLIVKSLSHEAPPMPNSHPTTTTTQAAARGFGGSGGSSSYSSTLRETAAPITSAAPVLPDKHKSHVQCATCGAENVIDLKNGHACEVEQVGGVQVIRDGTGLSVYALSQKSVEFLNLDEAGADFKTFMFDKKSDIERTIRSAKPTARFVLLLVE